MLRPIHEEDLIVFPMRANNLLLTFATEMQTNISDVPRQILS